MEEKRKVALVLSSGGARGYAHIGAIDALGERGYEIASIAGTSMGAMIGGLYCAGKWAECKEWFLGLERREMLSFLDVSLSLNHLLKGEKVMRRLEEIVPDHKIETLPVPFRAIAADLATHREVVFRRGSLIRAIRASISIPSVFRPVRVARHLLVDGGIVNPLPLNRAVRTSGDLLISVNVSAPFEKNIPRVKEQKSLFSFFPEMGKTSEADGIPLPGNYLTLMREAFTLCIERQTVSAQKLTPPDMAVNIPMNRFGAFDFDRAEEISRAGYVEMQRALDAFDAR